MTTQLLTRESVSVDTYQPGEIVGKIGSQVRWTVVHVCASGAVCVSRGGLRTFTSPENLYRPAATS